MNLLYNLYEMYLFWLISVVVRNSILMKLKTFVIIVPVYTRDESWIGYFWIIRVRNSVKGQEADCLHARPQLQLFRVKSTSRERTTDIVRSHVHRDAQADCTREIPVGEKKMAYMKPGPERASQTWLRNANGSSNV